jgi:hypothetical protein
MAPMMINAGVTQMFIDSTKIDNGDSPMLA